MKGAFSLLWASCLYSAASLPVSNVTTALQPQTTVASTSAGNSKTTAKIPGEFALPPTYSCNSVRPINMVLPKPIPRDGALVIGLSSNGSSFSNIEIVPRYVLLFENASNASFSVILGGGVGSLTLSFTLSGPSNATYLFSKTVNIVSVVCPELDPKNPKWCVNKIIKFLILHLKVGEKFCLDGSNNHNRFLRHFLVNSVLEAETNTASRHYECEIDASSGVDSGFYASSINKSVPFL